MKWALGFLLANVLCLLLPTGAFTHDHDEEMKPKWEVEGRWYLKDSAGFDPETIQKLGDAFATIHPKQETKNLEQAAQTLRTFIDTGIFEKHAPVAREVYLAPLYHKTEDELILITNRCSASVESIEMRNLQKTSVTWNINPYYWETLHRREETQEAGKSVIYILTRGYPIRENQPANLERVKLMGKHPIGTAVIVTPTTTNQPIDAIYFGSIAPKESETSEQPTPVFLLDNETILTEKECSWKLSEEKNHKK